MKNREEQVLRACQQYEDGLMEVVRLLPGLKRPGTDIATAVRIILNIAYGMGRWDQTPRGKKSFSWTAVAENFVRMYSKGFTLPPNLNPKTPLPKIPLPKTPLPKKAGRVNPGRGNPGRGNPGRVTLDEKIRTLLANSGGFLSATRIADCLVAEEAEPRYHMKKRVYDALSRKYHGKRRYRYIGGLYSVLPVIQ